MPGSRVEESAVVQYAIISENTVISKNAVVGARPEDTPNINDWGITVVGDNITIGENVVIPPKAMIDKDVLEAK